MRNSSLNYLRTILLKIFNFILNTVNIVERDAHPSGPLIRVETVKVRRKEGGTYGSVFLFSLVSAREEGGTGLFLLLLIRLRRHTGMGKSHSMMR